MEYWVVECVQEYKWYLVLFVQYIDTLTNWRKHKDQLYLLQFISISKHTYVHLYINIFFCDFHVMFGCCAFSFCKIFVFMETKQYLKCSTFSSVYHKNNIDGSEWRPGAVSSVLTSSQSLTRSHPILFLVTATITTTHTRRHTYTFTWAFIYDFISF